MMNQTVETRSIPVKSAFDVVVAGAGVAGIAASLAARRAGKKVLLLEKSCQLGGLATLGHVNYFVPMCNGRGKRIIRGMVDEFIRISTAYGYDTIPTEWAEGEPVLPTEKRYSVRFSACMFALALLELVQDEGIELSFDTLASNPVMDDGHCVGVIVENKSGRMFYPAGMIIDTTGDADLLYRAGVPTKEGRNYFSYYAYALDIEHCKKAIETGRIENAIYNAWGGNANLFGKNHPLDRPFYAGTTGEEVSQYLIDNQLELLRKIKNENRHTRQVISLPGMCQFRATRRIDGDYTLMQQDCYRHFEDSIAAVNDFEHRDFLYEVPYRTLVRTGFDNLITAGRSVAGADYAWDILRVIPPAIITGQAAGLAAVQALSTNRPIYDIDVFSLQTKLQNQGVMIHFDDEWIPSEGPFVNNVSKL
ncbi:MAG: FAD-dependent oxidoreductase [Christensenellales bacterium]|jgi:hypothetical protein